MSRSEIPPCEHRFVPAQAHPRVGGAALPRSGQHIGGTWTVCERCDCLRTEWMDEAAFRERGQRDVFEELYPPVALGALREDATVEERCAAVTHAVGSRRLVALWKFRLPPEQARAVADRLEGAAPDSPAGQALAIARERADHHEERARGAEESRRREADPGHQISAACRVLAFPYLVDAVDALPGIDASKARSIVAERRRGYFATLERLLEPSRLLSGPDSAQLIEAAKNAEEDADRARIAALLVRDLTHRGFAVEPIRARGTWLRRPDAPAGLFVPADARPLGIWMTDAPHDPRGSFEDIPSALEALDRFAPPPTDPSPYR